MIAEPRVQQLISNLVQRIVSGYRPERIILFGSYAYGRPDEDSDIDLLIIKETSERPIDRRVTVRRIAYDASRGIPISPLVLTPSELAQRLKSGDAFLKEIVTRGQVLYG